MKDKMDLARIYESMLEDRGLFPTDLANEFSEAGLSGIDLEL